MSILETFYILFKGDTSDLDKKSEEVQKSSKKTEEAIEKSGKAASNAHLQFQSLANSFVHFAAAAVGVGAVIGGFKEAVSYSIELAQSSQALGVNAATLDAWGYAVQRTGGTAQGFRHSLQGLAEHLGTTANVAIKVLPQLADVFHKVNRAAAFQYGKSLGLDESTILLLQQGRREVEAVINKQKELGVLTQKDSEEFLKFNNTLNDTGHVFRELFTTLAIAALPILTKFFEGTQAIANSLRNHKDFIVGAFLAIGAAVAVMAAPLVASYGAIVGIIALLGVAYEDIKAFIEGKNSLIGEISNKYGFHIPGAEERKGQELENQKNYEAFQALSTTDKLLTLFGKSPINNGATNVFDQDSFQRNYAVNTGPVTINTQATDATGIARDFHKSLSLTQRLQYQQTANQFANGELA